MSPKSEGGFSDPPEGPAGIPVDNGPRYEITGLVGRGGMGEVLGAWDRRLGREVALKRVQPEIGDPHLAARLIREAQVTGALDHPSVVPVHDLGELEDGQQFYTMRLIRGRTLAEARSELTPAAVVRHVLVAVQAVAYAHSRGVVHRDLKPENIMVGRFGETQVVDWGLARRVDEGEADGEVDTGNPALTRLGAVIGTPRYLAPEVAAGGRADRQSDVYALGASLVEAMTGESADTVAGWRALAAGMADRELGAIAGHALAPTADRYADASDLGADLEAWLDGRRVSVHQYGAWELLVRFVRAWRAPLAVAGLASVVGAGGLAVGGLRIVAERDRAVAAEAVADLALAEALATQAVAAVGRGARPEAEQAASRALALADLPLARGALMAWAAVPMPRVERIEGACAGRWHPTGVCQEGERLTAGGHTWEGPFVDARLVDGGLLVLGESQLAYGDQVFASRDGLLAIHGRRVALHDPTHVTLGTVDRVTTVAGGCQGRNPSSGGAWVSGRYWYVCDDQGAISVDPDGGREVWPLEGLQIPTLAVGGGGSRLVLGNGTDTISVFDRETGAVARVVGGVGRVRGLAVSEDGRWARITGARGAAELLDLDRGRAVLGLDDAWARSVFVDGALVRGGAARVRLSLDGLRPASFQADAGLALGVWSPRGEVVAGDGAGAVWVWDPTTGQRVARLALGHSYAVKGIAFDAEGAIATTSQGPPTAFDADWRPVGPVEGGPPSCKRLYHLEPDSWPCLLYGSGAVDVHGGPLPGLELGFEDGGQSSPRALVLLDSQQGVWRWDGSGPERIGHFPDALRVHVDAEGDRVVVGGDALHLVDGDGAAVARWPLRDPVTDVAISGDGAWVAASYLDGTIDLWTAEGELRATLSGVHDARVASIAFGDGALLSASWDGRAHLWGLGPLAEVPTPEAVAARWAVAPPVP